VEVLVSNQADMVAINEEGHTPADLAKSNQHGKIALRLEAHMVFSVSPTPSLAWLEMCRHCG